MALTLKSPAPYPVSIGNIVQGLTSSGQHGSTMWLDSGGEKHFIHSFGGSGSLTERTLIHHINVTTGDNHLVSTVLGQCSGRLHDPATGRLYLRGHYVKSFGYFTPSTGLFTSILDGGTSDEFGAIVLGDDGVIYLRDFAGFLYSYTDAGGLVTYGNDGVATAVIPNPSDAQFAVLAIDATHIYFGMPKADLWDGTTRWYTLKIGLIGADADEFVAWEFDDEGDFELTLRYCWNSVTEAVDKILLRTVAGDSEPTLFYKLSGGTYTAVTEVGNPEYTWSGGLPSATSSTDQLNTPYCYTQSKPGGTMDDYGWEIDIALVVPIPDAQEYSKILYREIGEGAYSTSQIAYTTPWQSFDPSVLVHDSGTDIIALGSSYSNAAQVDYSVPSSTFPGGHFVSPYGMLKHSTGLIFYCGYANLFFVWDPAAVGGWTLNGTNSGRYTFGDPEAPNPYAVNINKTGITYHYRHCLVEDANALVWHGGNATRSVYNPGAGDVCWYNASTGDFGYVFDGTGGKPDWDDLAYYFRSLCTAKTGAKIVASCSAGLIYVIDAATQAVEGSVDVGADAYMVETSDDVVIGVTDSSEKFKFKPSDRSMTISPTALTTSGNPFGFDDNDAGRRKFKLVRGPDGYAWLFIGNKLTRINPDDLSEQTIKYFSVPYVIDFIDVNGDQTEYDLLLSNNGAALYNVPSLFYTPSSGGAAEPGPEAGHLISVAGIHAASFAGGRIGTFAGGRL